MDIYLVDGTYELFRHFFVVPKSSDSKGQEIGATRAVLGSVLNMVERGARYVGVATDHVIESFRNDLYPHYKTGEGIEEALYSQFPILEESLQSMGVKVWPMVEFEADDALAAAAVKAADLADVDKVIICTPDKDLSQCVVGDRIVQLDRMRNTTRNEAGVIEKFGVSPKSIPDYLALVGDSADGYPGLPGWGAKASGTVLGLYGHLENIPKLAEQWNSSIRGAKKLAGTLHEQWDDAILFRKLATLRHDVPVFNSIEELRWRGPEASFEATCERLKSKDLLKRCNALLDQISANV
ncbi:MAG: hypothetical protein K2X77_03225 [Candidatus Obscuribacterales bacterium]|jgi:5'-3' exonuclease|nr:hypothetical protein [Candidatus Obscuribacterales bacterium]